MVLTIQEGTKGFVVYCDIARVQHGKVVAYSSRQLKVYEKNYPTPDLELATNVFFENM